MNYVIMSIYFLWNGFDLFQLMNNGCITISYRHYTRRKCCLILITILTYINITYVIYYLEYLLEKNSAVIFIEAFAYYQLHLYLILYLLILYYFKYSTYQQILRQYRKFCLNPLNPAIIERFIRFIQIMARINEKFHHCYSLIFLSNFICNTIDLIISSVSIAKRGYESFANTTFVSTTMLSLILIGNINTKLQSLLLNIKNENNHLLIKLFQRQHYRRFFIKLHEIEIYFHYFQLNVYNLFIVDLKLIFHTFIFASVYCMLIVQTEKGQHHL